MRRLERSRRADRDLLDILDFGTQRFGSRVGGEYFLSFDAAFERLRRNPGMGTSVSTTRPADTYRLTHRRHRIFFQVTDDAILILRVLHYAQDSSQLEN